MRPTALTPPMTVTVLLFASYADALGRGAVELELAPDATVDDVVAALQVLAPAGQLPPRPLVAVNQRYASAGDRVASGDEIAVIPPVAGG
jgi:molybdopterin converting factor small subunit